VRTRTKWHEITVLSEGLDTQRPKCANFK